MMPERCAGCDFLIIVKEAIEITEFTAGCRYYGRSLYRILDQRRCKVKKLMKVQKEAGG